MSLLQSLFGIDFNTRPATDDGEVHFFEKRLHLPEELTAQAHALNYSVARTGAEKAYWLIYIILHFVLGFIYLCHLNKT